MKKAYAIINLIITIAVVYWNSVVGANGYNGVKMAELSDKYYSLFTPAGYAFSIWGVIFIGLLIHAYYQIKMAFFKKEHSDFLDQMGPWLIIANVLNGLWIWAWLTERTGLSVLIMLGLLISLIILVIKLNMERWDAPFVVIRNIWWPIVIYFGWICVATIANISAYLVKIDWQSGLENDTWAVIMIIVATVLNLAILYFRSMREFVMVGIWAIAAIAYRQWDVYPNIQWTAVICSVILALASCYHAYLNWETNPVYKMLNKKKV
jgi:hypothetical protein